MNTNVAKRKDAKEIIEDLGWPSDIPVERLVASAFNAAMENGMIESAVILGFTFDRIELPGWADRHEKLMIAINALAHFASDRGLLEKLRFNGTLVSDDVLESDEWNAQSPMLPGMHGLYEAARRDWDRDKAEPAAG